MNPYNFFRRPGTEAASFNSISKRFDQPSYLTFRLEIGRNDQIYNGAGFGQLVNYDIMPHPLFMSKGSDTISDRVTYSSIDYLMDANEFTRANMLRQFINKFNRIQYDFPWYFKKIEGLKDLMTVDPIQGMRVKSDSRLVITALEGLDLRMSHILNLYKKIAWDDTYQRWVLPDMMRYFTMKIYISEFRTFHVPNQYDGNGYGNTSDQEFSEAGELWLKILDDTLPTWVINCEMCEFDIQNINFDFLGNLGVDETPEEAGVQFSIKIGKIYEEQVYPSFKNMYLIDKALNGFDRAKRYDEINTINEKNQIEKVTGDFDSTDSNQNNNYTKYGMNILGLAQNTLEQDKSHLSSTPFNERANDQSLYGAKGAGKDGQWFSEDDKYTPNPTDPNTWVGNALDFGGAYLQNEVESFIDKAKITPIPGLGFSPTELGAAIQGKDIISTLGLIKKSVDAVTNTAYGPSALLEGGISNEVFMSFLNSVAQSKATSEDSNFIQIAATEALNNNSILAKVLDYSLATNLVSDGETNINQPILNKNNYRDAVKIQTGNDRSTATDLDGGPKKIQLTQIFDSAPTSAATTNKLI